VLSFLENAACQTYRVPNAFDRTHRAGAKTRSDHQNGVELGIAVAIEMRTDTRIKDRIVFEVEDGFFAGIHGRTPGLKDCPAPGESALRTRTCRFFDFRSKGSCASVNNES
jgi:hypothetical protein